MGLDEDLAKANKVLKKGGDFVSIANFNPESKSTDEVRFAVFLIKSTGAELSKLVQLADEGKLQVPVDSTVAFEDVLLPLDGLRWKRVAAPSSAWQASEMRMTT